MISTFSIECLGVFALYLRTLLSARRSRAVVDVHAALQMRHLLEGLAKEI